MFAPPPEFAFALSPEFFPWLLRARLAISESTRSQRRRCDPKMKTEYAPVGDSLSSLNRFDIQYLCYIAEKIHADNYSRPLLDL